MKKICNDTRVIYISDEPADILEVVEEKLPYPFTKDMLELLKKENLFPQEYFYVKDGDRYAFFTVYTEKLDIFTYGKLSLKIKIKVVGFPCSLSCSGFVTNDFGLLMDTVKRIKGGKLVLNIDKPEYEGKLAKGETLPTCMFRCNFSSAEEYMSKLRSPYRRRLNLALTRSEGMEKIFDRRKEYDIYPLYLGTYEKSNYKLERLEKGFFEKVDAERIVYVKDGKPRGFTLLKKDGDLLIFMLCGMDYSMKTADLYYRMLLGIIEYAIENKCTEIDFGQTSEATKLKFGAYLSPKYFYAHMTNPFLNFLARIGHHILEYKYSFPDYRVFTGKGENAK